VNFCEQMISSHLVVNVCLPGVHKFTLYRDLIPRRPRGQAPRAAKTVRKRIRIELEDDEGTKYTLALEGKLSRDKLMKAAELLEIMDVPLESSLEKPSDKNTFFGKVHQLIEDEFSSGDFSSSDVAREFEEKHGEPVRLSTISTYLSRLADKDFLRRERFGNSWVYRRAFLKASQIAEK
jgi:hypothetical protein